MLSFTSNTILCHSIMSERPLSQLSLGSTTLMVMRILLISWASIGVKGRSGSFSHLYSFGGRSLQGTSTQFYCRFLAKGEWQESHRFVCFSSYKNCPSPTIIALCGIKAKINPYNDRPQASPQIHHDITHKWNVMMAHIFNHAGPHHPQGPHHDSRALQEVSSGICTRIKRKLLKIWASE